MTSILVPIKGMSGDGGYVDFPTKVPREIAEMGSLLDDRTSTNESMSVIDLHILDQNSAHLLDLSHQSGFAIDS
jgi:hypothetical protein